LEERPLEARIAIVEDDPSVSATVEDLFETAGYTTVHCETGEELMRVMQSLPLDLIVLDLQLPDRDGVSLASTIRSMSDVPIVMLTGRGGELDRIVGLEVGADDYVVKPFSNLELLARVKAVLRRSRPSTSPRKRPGYRFAGHFLDLHARRLEGPDGAVVQLTVAEFELLLALLKAEGRVLTRDQLLDMTHHADADVFDRTIDVLILRLRRKIEPVPSRPQFIVTERGLGYTFAAKVEAFDG
jgi:two-component system OmpR family response regulator